tara:strand:- start:20685 stop:20900 length:216 start_codon:yes stop_codon:yes gene_type:complete
MDDKVININGKEYNPDKMSDKEKYQIAQIRDLQSQESKLMFQLDAIRVAKNAFTNSLIQSVEQAKEESKVS